jgi:hypothetical protein
MTPAAALQARYAATRATRRADMIRRHDPAGARALGLTPHARAPVAWVAAEGAALPVWAPINPHHGGKLI